MGSDRVAACRRRGKGATPLAKAQEPAKQSPSVSPASVLEVSTSQVYLKSACAPPRPVPVGPPSSSPLCSLALTCPEQNRHTFRHPGPTHPPLPSLVSPLCLSACVFWLQCLIACVACSACLPPNAPFLKYGPVPVTMRLEWSTALRPSLPCAGPKVSAMPPDR